MAVTIKDIAKAANVSLTTVSRVINNKSEGMSEETRKKILDLIEEFGYQPNAIARGLVTKKTKTVGLIVPDITNPFYPDIARGVEDGASKCGYTVFLCNTDDDLEKERQYIDSLKEKCVDGIIFATGRIVKNSYVLSAIKSGLPTVIMGKQNGVKGLHGVVVDDYAGGYLATKHLIELGHTKIGCIIGSMKRESTKDRLNGYKKALEEAGLQIEDDIIVEGDYRMDGGNKSMAELLAKKKVGEEITAVFVCNDFMAYGAYKAIKAMNFKVPEDISVVGFDDISLSQMIDPGLTTIRQPAYEMGLEAVNILIKQIENRRVRKKVITLNPDVIIRQSTCRIK